MICLHHSGRAWHSSPIPRPLSTPSFPAVFWLLFAVGFPPGARDGFFRSEFDTHTRGAVPGGAGTALPAWQGRRARAGAPAAAPSLGCDPRDRFHSIIGQIFSYQISAQVSTSLARIIRNIQGKPGAFSHLLFASNLFFWGSGWSTGKGSSRMTIHGQSSGICLNSKQIWRKKRKPGSLC